MCLYEGYSIMGININISIWQINLMLVGPGYGGQFLFQCHICVSETASLVDVPILQQPCRNSIACPTKSFVEHFSKEERITHSSLKLVEHSSGRMTNLFNSARLLFRTG